MAIGKRFILHALVLYSAIILGHSSINVTTRPQSVLVDPKTTFGVECQVITNETNISLTWQKDGRDIKSTTIGLEPSVYKSSAISLWLNFGSVRRRDSGIYKCVAVSRSTGEKHVATSIVNVAYEYDNMSRKYENVKQIPSTNSSQLFYIKIMVVVAAALFSIIAIALVVYIYGKRKTRTQEKDLMLEKADIDMDDISEELVKNEHA